MKARLSILILLLASAFTLPACGGGGDDEGGGGQQKQAPAETAGGGQTVSSVSLSEYKFDPADLTAKAGSTLTVKNEGSLGHDLRLRKPGKEVGGTKVFGAGKSEQLKVDFAPGKYEMYCSVPGHEQQGMKGSFTIR